MKGLIACAVLAVCVSASPARAEVDLVAVADRMCLQPDGDRELTWGLAVADGYQSLKPEDFTGLNLPGARRLAGFRRMIDGVEVTVLTAVSRPRGYGRTGGAANFHVCWVSARASPDQRLADELSLHLDVPSFRIRETVLHAWKPQEDGSRVPVTRRELNHNWLLLARRDGMRMVLSKVHEGEAMITYMAPQDGCADWCY